MGTIPTIARTALLAVPALLLGLGLGETFAFDEPAGAPQPSDRGALDLTPHHSVVVEGIPGTRGWLSERCPAGQVVAGGFSHVGSGLRVTESRPDGIYAWRISWVQTSTDDAVLYVYAICLLEDE